MAIGRISPAIYNFSLLIELCRLDEPARIVMQILDVFSNKYAICIIPRARPYTVPRIDAIGTCCTQIRPPGPVFCSDRFCKQSTVRISALKSSKIGAISRTGTGDEETHARLYGHLGLFIS